jgi:cytidylate kinase
MGDVTMAVVTVSRQLGSAGDYIASLVASMLAYRLVSKQSIIVEARKRQLIHPEAAEVGEGKPPLLERFDRKKSRAVYAMRSILREIATKGNAVIVGRGGYVELRDYAGVFKVRIIADSETRVARLKRENGIDRAQAVKMLKQSDKERAQYVKHFFLADSSDPGLYDLVINTSKIPPDVAANLIVQAVRQVAPTRISSSGD